MNKTDRLNKLIKDYEELDEIIFDECAGMSLMIESELIERFPEFKEFTTIVGMLDHYKMLCGNTFDDVWFEEYEQKLEMYKKEYKKWKL